MEKSEFFVPSHSAEYQLVEKKSRFLGQIFQVHSEEEAKAQLESVKKQYHDARHHCYCFILDQNFMRYSDDGEPQGTAGQPMLHLFQKEKIEQVCCVVTRYFGGTLLGTGGLVRAYTHCAKGCLDAAGLSCYETLTEIEVICPYPHWDTVQKIIADSAAVTISTDFAVDVTVCLRVAQPQAFHALLTEKTAGNVLADTLGKVAELVPYQP